MSRLPSGLLYRVEASGSGAYPTTESRVQVHYRGTLQDGTTFDSSYDRGNPATFGVTQVIKGWTEALLLMREGDKCHTHCSTPALGTRTHTRPRLLLLMWCVVVESVV